MEEVQSLCPAHHGSISGLFGLAGIDTLLADEEHQVSILSFAQADQVLKDPSTYSSVPLYDRTLRSAIGETILGMDPPGHRRFRELIQPAFTRKEMECWERSLVEDIVNSYLTPLIPLGRADLATDFTFLYPITSPPSRPGSPSMTSTSSTAIPRCSPTSPSPSHSVWPPVSGWGRSCSA